jgi:hypothetical protein
MPVILQPIVSRSLHLEGLPSRAGSMITMRRILPSLLLSAACVHAAPRSSAVATVAPLSPSNRPVSVLFTHDPDDATEIGIVEADGKRPLGTLDGLLAEIRSRSASLGGDVARIDRFATRYEMVTETYEYDCSTFETRTEPQTVTSTQADGTTTTSTQWVAVTEFVSKTCTGTRDVEVRTLTLTGRAFRTTEETP